MVIHILKGQGDSLTRDKEMEAIQQMRHPIALSKLDPSYSLWASGVVMVKKKRGKMHFCYVFTYLNEITDSLLPPPWIVDRLANSGMAFCSPAEV